MIASTLTRRGVMALSVGAAVSSIAAAPDDEARIVALAERYLQLDRIYPTTPAATKVSPTSEEEEQGHEMCDEMRGLIDEIALIPARTRRALRTKARITMYHTNYGEIESPEAYQDPVISLCRDVMRMMEG